MRLSSRLRLPLASVLIVACAEGSSFDAVGGGGADGDGGDGASGAGDAGCDGADCSVNATCDDSSGEAVCTCKPGFDGDGQSCMDADECAADPCGEGTCVNVVGSYQCDCNPGYEEQGGTCVAVGGCAVDNGGCADGCTCADVGGSPECSCTLTHSSSQTITSGNSVGCTYGTGTEHAENSYYRVFDLASFGIDHDFDVTSVEIGVELAQSTAPPQPVNVRLYRLNGSLTLANMNSLGSSSVTVANVANTVLEFAVSGTAVAGSDLVVEVHTPDSMGLGHLFFVGSNTSAETDASYLRAPTCGFPEPTPTATIGYPDMHIVMNVNGTYSP